MTTPKKPPPLDRDRFEEMQDSLGRNLDENLAVQGSDESQANSADEDAAAALGEHSGDPFVDDDEDDGEVIPLPEETLRRGSRRP